MATREKTLEDLFLDTLKDVYHAEKQIIKALPKMARAAGSAELKTAFTTHLEETRGQVVRLEQVFELLDKAARAKPCAAMLGLVEEGQEIMEEFTGPALDAGLLSSAQAVEHYEIARYGTLAAWADELGMGEAAGLLRETLAEEKKTDEILSGLAEQRVNAQAA
jgi:ferritin-like metal-binding protein YciE